jgi:NADPH:quinone reductase-like Zn-dependent oxidoreductase
LTSPNDVLVKINRAGLNAGGSIVMQAFPYILRAKSTIPDLDFSGVLEEIGDGVPKERNLSVGTQVFGSVDLGSQLKFGRGALADYVVVPSSSVIARPRNISLAAAAGLPVAGCTAIELIRNSGLKRGDSALVNGASSGIGHMALQMAKNIVGDSGKVIAVCSGANAATVGGLGPDEVRNSSAAALPFC